MGSYNAGIIHKSPTMDGYGTCDIWREGNNIRVKGKAGLHKAGGYNRAFGYHYAAAVYWKGSNTGNWFYIKNNNDSYRNVEMRCEANFDITLENYTDAGRVDLVYICCGSGDGTYGNRCDVGWGERTVYGADIGTAYTAPSIWLNPNDYSNIGKVGETVFGVHYSLTKGTDNLHWTRAQLFNYNSKSHIWFQQFGRTTTSPGYWDYYKLPTDKFGDGQRYRLACSTWDGKTEPWSPDNPAGGGNGLEVKTYRIPVIRNFNISKNLFSPQDNPTLSWTTNSRTWVNYESNFYTELKTSNYTKSVNGNPVNNTDGGVVESNVSATLTENDLNNFFTSSQRSVNKMSRNLSLNRVSRNLYRVAKDVTVNVQYQPTKLPTNYVVTNGKGNTVTNSTIIIQDVPEITLDWTYPVNSGAAGVINGYILKIYKDDSYSGSSKVGNDIDLKVSKNSTVATIKLNTKTQLFRGSMNYIEIIPYYLRPDNNGYIYGTQKLRASLVKPISILNTPKIDYPVNNSNWHNKDFRILFELPIDDDKDQLNITDNNYVYQDIEVKIIPISGSTLVYSYKKNPTIFSANKLTYRRKIAIKPSIVASMPSVSSYTIQVRVQKNYYITSGELSYSKWSSPITIKNTQVMNQNLNVGDEIYATQYNYVRDASVRLFNTYPIIKPIPSTNISKSSGTIIDGVSYKGIVQTIENIIKGVNGYCTYDKSNIKLPEDPDKFVEKVETITADKANTTLSGRNYIKIITDKINALK